MPEMPYLQCLWGLFILIHIIMQKLIITQNIIVIIQVVL